MSSRGTFTKFATGLGLFASNGVTSNGVVYGAQFEANATKPASFSITGTATEIHPFIANETNGAVIAGNKNGELMINTGKGDHFSIYSIAGKSFKAGAADGWEVGRGVDMNDRGEILVYAKKGTSSIAVLTSLE